MDKERRAKTLRTLLKTADISYQETKLTYDRHLFVCKPSRKDHHVVRLAVLGDTGKGKGRSRHISVVSAMRLVYGAKSFDDGILMLGDNLFSGEADIGNPTAVARREFEKPFASLLKTGVPFYAVLGNHDYMYGLQSFELTYPLFHMQDRRYYTKTFGDGLVEVFFLDSNSFYGDKPEPDPDQINWLEQVMGESQSAWKIIALHHPLYSTARDSPLNMGIRQKLESLFQKHNVSLVLQGHNHIYERLAPIKGIHYITAGSGGSVDYGGLSSNASQRITGNDQIEVFLILEFDSKICRLTAYNSLVQVIDKKTIEMPRSEIIAPANVSRDG